MGDKNCCFYTSSLPLPHLAMLGNIEIEFIARLGKVHCKNTNIAKEIAYVIIAKSLRMNMNNSDRMD